MLHQPTTALGAAGIEKHHVRGTGQESYVRGRVRRQLAKHATTGGRLSGIRPQYSDAVAAIFGVPGKLARRLD